MNVISFRKLKEFYEIHPDAKPYLTSWFKQNGGNGFKGKFRIITKNAGRKPGIFTITT